MATGAIARPAHDAKHYIGPPRVAAHDRPQEDRHHVPDLHDRSSSFIGGVLALLVRTQLAWSNNSFLSQHQYNQFFTMHASTMLFLFVIPVGAGFGNYLLPLMIGAKDMAYPRINAFSLWLIPLAAVFMFSSFFVEGGSAAGRLDRATRRSREKTFMPGHGTDLWILGVQILGISSVGGAHQLPRHDDDDAGAGHDPGAACRSSSG